MFKVYKRGETEFMDQLDLLLYADEKYIESIYNFYYPNIMEITEGETRGKDKKIGLAGKLFKNFAVTIDGEASIDFNNISVTERKIHPSVEQKIISIIDSKFDGKPRVLLELLGEIQKNGIYYFQGVYELLTIENKNGKDIIRNTGYRNNPKGLVWKLKLISYGSNVNVNMAMSGDKILMNYHHLTEEIEKYKRFTFNILGKITKFDDINYSIKPIVIFYL